MFYFTFILKYLLKLYIVYCNMYNIISVVHVYCITVCVFLGLPTTNFFRQIHCRAYNSIYYTVYRCQKTKTRFVRKSNSGIEPSAIGNVAVTVAYELRPRTRILCFSRPIWHRHRTPSTVFMTATALFKTHGVNFYRKGQFKKI